MPSLCEHWQDLTISRDTVDYRKHQHSGLNFRSDDMKENCNISIDLAFAHSPLAKEDIARITLEYISVEKLLLVRATSSMLRHFVNQECSSRLISDLEHQPDLNCLVKAMHGTFAVRKGVRSLKTLVVSLNIL